MCNRFVRAMLRRTRGPGGQIPPACPTSGHGNGNKPSSAARSWPTSDRSTNYSQNAKSMLPANSTTGLKREPHVAVCVDKAHAYGRGILMGLADYMDMFGRWSLYVDIHSTGQLSAQ